MAALDVNRPKHPTGITVVAVLCLIGGIVILLFGLVIILIINLGHIPITSGLTFSMTLFIVMGMWGIAVCAAFFIGKKSGWIFGVISFGLACIVSTGTLVLTYPSGYEYNLVFIGITGFIVYYLFRPHVKAYFGKRHDAALK